MKLSFGLPSAVRHDLAGATALHQLEIDLEGNLEWGSEEVQFAGLPFEALSALPSLGKLEELTLRADEDPDNVRWDLVDARAHLISERRSVHTAGEPGDGSWAARRQQLLSPRLLVPAEVAAAAARQLQSYDPPAPT